MSHESNYDGSMMQVDPVALAAYALHTSPGTYAVLLGSGLSAAAGIPTGWDITLDLKLIDATKSVGDNRRRMMRADLWDAGDYADTAAELWKDGPADIGPLHVGRLQRRRG